MKVESSVVSHFSASVGRYTEPPPEPGDFVLRAFDSEKRKNLQVLELGCGTGHRLEGLLCDHPGYHLAGLDITPIMVQTASQARSPKIGFMVGDCLNVPFPSGSFDAVIMFDVLHHLVTSTKTASNILRADGLKELTRLLPPGGRIVMEEVCVNAAWRSQAIFATSHLISRTHISIPSLHIHTDVVLNFFTLQELDDALAQAGFHILEKEVDRFPGLGVRLATFGDTTYHVRLVAEKVEQVMGV